MSDQPLHEKWDALYRDAQVGAASRVLIENAHLLPASGDALDMACGMGANGFFLAQRGLRVAAWDVSSVAIDKINALAAQCNLAIAGVAKDVVVDPPASNSFDVIVVAHFLERGIFPALLAALKPRGLLFYQTFTQARTNDAGPRNEAYRLADNELVQLCGTLRLMVYREEGTVGDTRIGFRNLAMLVGQKR